jgi:hypothetical protein
MIEHSKPTVEQLQQFVWLLENATQERSPSRLSVLWQWGCEMAYFQQEANLTGTAIEYFQRGSLVRVLRPDHETQDAETAS